jgi:hypothetical protein
MKEENNWVVDVKQTLYQNMMLIPMYLLAWIFAFVGLSKVHLFTDQGFQIMYLIVILLATLKLFALIGHPRIELKREIK